MGLIRLLSRSLQILEFWAQAPSRPELPTDFRTPPQKFRSSAWV
ncbi:MAG: hypothetical protein ACAF42_06285 [Limnothrix sp. BL-A-16]